ncbi:3-hydroxyisobutyrate dehydrogenase [Neisseria leonii]|uniref:3-hydroxyisobutyrate dehydrogenase n=1 Tax=Neisseria leonii TaxID=2995413 RepID=UPI0030D58FAB
MKQNMPHIAFIGLGNMGAPMAVNLLKQGYRVSVADVNAEAVSALVAQGAYHGGTPHQAAEGADAVITMLPDGRQVKAVYLGAEGGKGILDVLSAGALAVDCSTIAADDARLVAAEAVKRGIAFADAPVSGGTAGAAAATLSFMVGAETADFERALPLLRAMGRNVFHAGGCGAGQTAKICNNMLLGILMTGTAEAIALGVRSGLDAAVLSDIMAKSSGGNWVLNVYNPYPGAMENVPAANAYRNGFSSRLMLKDLRLAAGLSESAGLETPMGEQARQMYEHFAADPQNGSLDFSAVLGEYLPQVLPRR